MCLSNEARRTAAGVGIGLGEKERRVRVRVTVNYYYCVLELDNAWSKVQGYLGADKKEGYIKDIVAARLHLV